MEEVREERKIRLNGDTAYVNVPQTVLKAMNLPISELFKARVVFKMRDGKLDIDLEVPK